MDSIGVRIWHAEYTLGVDYRFRTTEQLSRI